MYIDGIRFKIREDSVYKEKSVYLIIGVNIEGKKEIGVNIEGKKEILGFWIAESESSKQWLMIFDELKVRRLKKVLLTCCNNLKRISETLKAAFPNVHIQKCVIHQIRNSTKHLFPKDVASFTSDMKKIYKSPSYDADLKALILLKNLEEKNIHMLSNHEKIILMN